MLFYLLVITSYEDDEDNDDFEDDDDDDNDNDDDDDLSSFDWLGIKVSAGDSLLKVGIPNIWIKIFQIWASKYSKYGHQNIFGFKYSNKI